MTKELESLIRHAAEALLAAGAKQVYLFGSVARGKDEQSARHVVFYGVR